jgi:hypothetical protein
MREKQVKFVTKIYEYVKKMNLNRGGHRYVTSAILTHDNHLCVRLNCTTCNGSLQVPVEQIFGGNAIKHA